ncbi:hypothetical protein VF08_34665, partial [Nostoc linckia z8]
RIRMVFWLLGEGRCPFNREAWALACSERNFGEAVSCDSDILGGKKGVSCETVLNNTIFN